MPAASDITRTARRAGLLYLVISILASISYFYLRPHFVVPRDPASTARNILANEQLYRVGILIDLLTQVLFIFLALELYRLFREVDRNQARIMVGLVGVGTAVQFAGFALNAAPLIFLGQGDALSAFTRPQLEGLAYASLSLGEKQGEQLTLLWGLWLFPFAVLTIRSGFLPKFLGVLLILTGVAYVLTCVVSLVFPAQAERVGGFLLPFYFGELIVVLWLAFVGARPRVAEA